VVEVRNLVVRTDPYLGKAPVTLKVPVNRTLQLSGVLAYLTLSRSGNYSCNALHVRNDRSSVIIEYTEDIRLCGRVVLEGDS
jgi:hypothetical protein